MTYKLGVKGKRLKGKKQSVSARQGKHGDIIIRPVYNMSVRNKKLTALVGDSLGSSLQNSRNLRQHSHEARPDRTLLQKLAEKPPLRHLPGKAPREGNSVQRSTRFKSLRIHTEKFSPGKRSLANAQRSRTMAVRQGESEDPPERFPFLTKFQREQVARYEVHFIGGRRIHSLRDFTSSSCQARIAPGDAIAYRYEVLSLLGQGSFGQVFKSFDHRKRQMVALKVIRNETKFNRQAKVEMRILETATMMDPKGKSNIVQLKHGFFFRGHACLVFELLHINLYELSRELKFKGLTIDMIRRVAIQVLQGLLFLKRQNIIHCDLKPQNILLKQQGKTGIKIIDLGSGCFQPEQIYTYIQSRFYRAPEIILGLTYSPAIDTWSMGCILAELYLGYPLFPGENEQEQMLMFMEVLGVPPDSLIQRGSRSHKFFEGNMVRVRPNSKGKIRRPDSKSLEGVLACEDKDFMDFVAKFLVWEPQRRILPQEALMDPWVLKGLPPQIRKQHVAAVNRESYL